MLAHCSARRAAYVLHRPCRTVQPHRSPFFQRRTLTIETFTNGFLDLAAALPLPPSLPPYSTTIIICTVISRFLWTVPFSIWVSHPCYGRISLNKRLFVGKAETAARGGRGCTHNQFLKTWCIEIGSRGNPEKWHPWYQGPNTSSSCQTRETTRESSGIYLTLG